jgi:hypothetical protein
LQPSSCSFLDNRTGFGIAIQGPGDNETGKICNFWENKDGQVIFISGQKLALKLFEFLYSQMALVLLLSNIDIRFSLRHSYFVQFWAFS